MIAVLSALEPEIRRIVGAMQTPGSETWATRVFYKGQIENVEAVAGFTGVGKVLAAMVTQRIIDEYRPTAIIYVGIAGSLIQGLDIGDVVLSRDTLQHDMDATSFGFAPGEVPHEGIVEVPADRDILACAAGWMPKRGKSIVGRIVTGDRYVGTGDKASIQEKFSAEAVDMEGGAAGFVSFMSGVPFLLARVISDTAGGRTAKPFKSFLARASETLADLVTYLCREYFAR